MFKPTTEVVKAASLPATDDWLGPRERVVMARYRVPRRVDAWKAGRWAAKRAAARCAGVDASRVEILAAADGAPEAWIDEERLPVCVSISHRDGVAVAVAAPAGVDAGCDVELIEPRDTTFASDWFTAAEVSAVEGAAARDRDALITLIWSAKESVLKVLRQGLRLDTRQVEISISDHKFDAQVNGRRMSGWWTRDGRYVITAVTQEKRK